MKSLTIRDQHTTYSTPTIGAASCLVYSSSTPSPLNMSKACDLQETSPSRRGCRALQFLGRNPHTCRPVNLEGAGRTLSRHPAQCACH